MWYQAQTQSAKVCSIRGYKVALIQLDNVAEARICFRKLEAIAATTQLENLLFESSTSNGSLLQREGKYDLALALYQESFP